MGHLWIDGLVWVAALFFVLGYTLIDQVWLRLVSLAGSLCYILYYMIVPAGPLWSPAITNLIIALANIGGLTMLMLSRSRWAIPAGYEDLYDRFAPIAPGDFANLVRSATVVSTDTDLRLTTHDEGVPRLFFILEGAVRLEKDGVVADLAPRTFIGELALLTGHKASATTTLLAGGRALSWPISELTHVNRRTLRLRQTLDAAISRDMAEKIRASQPVAVAATSAPTLI